MLALGFLFIKIIFFNVQYTNFVSILFYFFVDTRKVNCKYLPIQDKILFWDEKNIGLRGDYNGVLLIETILQTPVLQRDDIVKVELLLAEAIVLLTCLKQLEENGLENTTDAINELTAKIADGQTSYKKGIKAHKVTTN